MIKTKSKYHSTWTEVDGIKFQSKREAKDWCNLRLLERAGEITNLERQIPYELNKGGSFSYKYVADFRYVDVKTGATIVADSKGFLTKEFKKKQKLMKSVYGIEIKLT